MPPGESWVDAEGTQPPYLRGGEGAPGPVLGRTLPGLRRDKAGSWVALLGPSCPLSPRPLHASGLFLPGVLPVCPSLPARQAGGWSTLLCARGAPLLPPGQNPPAFLLSCVFLSSCGYSSCLHLFTQNELDCFIQYIFWSAHCMPDSEQLEVNRMDSALAFVAGRGQKGLG